MLLAKILVGEDKGEIYKASVGKVRTGLWRKREMCFVTKKMIGFTFGCMYNLNEVELIDVSHPEYQVQLELYQARMEKLKSSIARDNVGGKTGIQG